MLVCGTCTTCLSHLAHVSSHINKPGANFLPLPNNAHLVVWKSTWNLAMCDVKLRQYQKVQNSLGRDGSYSMQTEGNLCCGMKLTLGLAGHTCRASRFLAVRAEDCHYVGPQIRLTWFADIKPPAWVQTSPTVQVISVGVYVTCPPLCVHNACCDTVIITFSL